MLLMSLGGVSSSASVLSQTPSRAPPRFSRRCGRNRFLEKASGAGSAYSVGRGSVSVHGFKTDIPVRKKSPALRVTTHRSCKTALAAMNRSGWGKVWRTALPFSMRRRQTTKTSSSTSSSRSANHGRSSLVSHASNRLRDRSAAGNRSMPYLISAIVTLLRYMLAGSWLSAHALTWASQFALRSSEITLVSKSQPLTARRRAPASGHFHARNPSPAAATETAECASLVARLPEPDARNPRQTGSPPRPCRAP